MVHGCRDYFTTNALDPATLTLDYEENAVLVSGVPATAEGGISVWASRWVFALYSAAAYGLPGPASLQSHDLGRTRNGAQLARAFRVVSLRYPFARIFEHVRVFAIRDALKRLTRVAQSVACPRAGDGTHVLQEFHAGGVDTAAGLVRLLGHGGCQAHTAQQGGSPIGWKRGHVRWYGTGRHVHLWEAPRAMWGFMNS